MANIYSVHDNFVRAVLSDKQVATDYFRSALPAHIADRLDFSPQFDYIYNNLRETPDEDIGASPNRFLAACLLVLKHAFDKRWLKGNFAGVLSIGLPHGSGDLKRALLLYYFDRVDFSEEKVKDVIKELPLIIKEDIMSTYELLIEKGRKEGIEKGTMSKSHEVVSNLILDFGFNDEQAARASRTSIEFVKKVRADLDKKKK